MRSKKKTTCYMCSAPATTREHAPPQCFFPEGLRENLITVPSCAEHNNGNSEDVEYTRNVICTRRDANGAASASFAKAMRSFANSPDLLTRTFRTLRPFGDGATFRVDLSRHQRVMRAIAFALYFRDNGHKHEGDWRIFTPSFLFAESLQSGEPDPWLQFRRSVELGEFTPRAVTQPTVFKYSTLRDGELVRYRFEFYESVVVHAWPLPHRLNSHIHVPVGRGRTGTIWELAED